MNKETGFEPKTPSVINYLPISQFSWWKLKIKWEMRGIFYLKSSRIYLLVVSYCLTFDKCLKQYHYSKHYCSGTDIVAICSSGKPPLVWEAQ